MICDTCKKLVVGEGSRECAVLQIKNSVRYKSEKLPIWGENCSAYTDDPKWEEKVKKAVKKYSLIKE